VHSERGVRCVVAFRRNDGSLLLESATSQGYRDPAGRIYRQSDLVRVRADGTPVTKKPSTLNTPQPFQRATPWDVLEHAVGSINEFNDPDGTPPGLGWCDYRYSLGTAPLKRCFFVRQADGQLLGLIGSPHDLPWRQPGEIGTGGQAAHIDTPGRITWHGPRASGGLAWQTTGGEPATSCRVSPEGEPIEDDVERVWVEAESGREARSIKTLYEVKGKLGELSARAPMVSATAPLRFGMDANPADVLAAGWAPRLCKVLVARDAEAADWLDGIGERLHKAGVIRTVGSGRGARGPVLLEPGGREYRGWLVGQVREDGAVRVTLCLG
jgi:hypothetical protein